MNITPQPWMDAATCRTIDPTIFYPPLGGDAQHLAKIAKAVCATCPVQTKCLTYALDNDERFGIWGGLDERERGKLRRVA